MALSVYNKLVAVEEGKEVNSLALRANAYLSLGFHDAALVGYKAANEIAEGKQGWVLANMGNLLNNVGLFSEAIEYLERANFAEPMSSYTHDRLAKAIKARDDEREKVEAATREGLAQLRAKSP